MSFSEEDIEALGQQLNLININLNSIANDVGRMKNILIAFTFAWGFGMFGVLLFFV
jgi:hypothetical protein